MASKKTPYFADYVILQDTDSEASFYLRSSAAMIGTPIFFSQEALPLDVSAKEETAESSSEAPVIEPVQDEVSYRVCVSTKEGKTLGYLPKAEGNRIIRAFARGLEVCGWLSLVLYDQDMGHYYGEVAYIAYDTSAASEETWNVYRETARKKLIQGYRPRLSLSEKELSRLLANGTHDFAKTQPLPDKRTGLAVFKRKMSTSDKLITRLLSKYI